MSLSLRTTILATGCILAIGTSAARAQMPLVSYYYPRRATTPRRRGRSTSRPPATTTTCRSTPSRLRSTLPRPRGLPIPPSTIPRIRARLTPRQIVRPRGPPTPPTPPSTIPAVGLPRRAAAALRMRATNAPAARMLVATTRTTRTGKPSRRKPMHRIPRSYSPLLAWDAPRS